MAERGTRFEQSVLTFGPVGRVVATVLVLWPLWWMLDMGVVGVIGAAIWLFWVLPLALRDIWRPAVLPATDLTRLRDESRRAAEAARDFEAKQAQASTAPEPPRRW